MTKVPPSIVNENNGNEPDVATCPACCSRKPWLYKDESGDYFRYICTCKYSTALHKTEREAREEWERIARLGMNTPTIIEQLTDNQVAMLNKIADTEYGFYDWDKRHRDNQLIATWADVILESKSDGGVFTALQNFGLVWYQDDPIERDNVLGLTSLGYLVVRRMRKLPFDWNEADDPMMVNPAEEYIACKKCGDKATLTYDPPSDGYYVHCSHCLASSDIEESKSEALRVYGNMVYLRNGDRAYGLGCYLVWDDVKKDWELEGNEDDTFFDWENVNYDGVGNAYIIKEKK